MCFDDEFFKTLMRCMVYMSYIKDQYLDEMLFDQGYFNL